jgi:hypothetical protein
MVETPRTKKDVNNRSDDINGRDASRNKGSRYSNGSKNISNSRADSSRDYENNQESHGHLQLQKCWQQRTPAKTVTPTTAQTSATIELNR